MAYAILCDEHTERNAAEYLRDEGHDAELIVDEPDLGPGTVDERIRAYAKQRDQLVLTSDEGFLAADPKSHAGVLFQPDDRLPAHEIARIVTTISEHIPQSDIERAVYVTEAWL